jgi:plasmid stabilization system protein ParE
MPRGDKSSYTDKQKRQAEHIEEGYKKRGVSSKTAAKRAWATVNKETGGGMKGKKSTGRKSASKKTAKKAAKKSSGRKSARSKK